MTPPVHLCPTGSARRRPLAWKTGAVACVLASLAACGGGGDLGVDDAVSDDAPTPLQADLQDRLQTLAATPPAAAAAVVRLPIAPGGVSASGHDGNRPEGAVDGDPQTRWSAQGRGQWIQLDLGQVRTVGSVKIAWRAGDRRRATFDVLLSVDGRSWATAVAGQSSSGRTTGLESVELPDTGARHVRIVGRGNDRNDWNSITELEVWGGTSGLAHQVPLRASAVTASADSGPHTAGRTVDHRADTRWSSDAEEPWIRYDLGTVRKVAYLALAWHRGQERVQTFDVDVSRDGSTWTSLLAGAKSSGRTAGLEVVDVPDTAARYVRIVGQGNTQNRWTSLAETQVFALPDTPLSVSVHGQGRVDRASGSGTDARASGSGTDADRAWGSGTNAGAVTGAGETALGDTVVLTARPAEGWRFSHWAGDADGQDNPLSVHLDRPRSVVAHFVSVTGGGSVPLTVATQGAGSVTRSPARASYPVGSSVRLTAVPDAGYRFDGWTGAVTGSANPIDVTLDAAKSVTARFVATSGCQTPYPALLKQVFKVEGDSPYQDDGCTLRFDAMASRHVTPNGHGWRNEVSVAEGRRKPMSQVYERLEADIQVDFSPGAKAIVAQYHAQGKGTISKVYVADVSENGTAQDGTFEVFVRTLPRADGDGKKKKEDKLVLGRIRSGETFRLTVINDRGTVTVSAFGKSLSRPVDDGGKSFLKFGSYLQAQHPVSNDHCPSQSQWAECYASYGVSKAVVTYRNVGYERRD